jgi:hypothetical protein
MTPTRLGSSEISRDGVERDAVVATTPAALEVIQGLGAAGARPGHDPGAPAHGPVVPAATGPPPPDPAAECGVGQQIRVDGLVAARAANLTSRRRTIRAMACTSARSACLERRCC